MHGRFRRQLQLALWAREHAFLPHVRQPDDWPVEARIGVGGLRPLRHGDYSSGLSATFAAVNGIRLVTADHCALSKRDEQQLLRKAWHWRLERDAVRPDRGLRQSEWLRMVQAICHHFMQQHSQFVTVHQPWRETVPDREEFFTTVERLIVGRRVILSLLAGAHYSVIRGYTRSSLLLFDSGEQCWMRRASVELVGSTWARHRISPRSTLVLGRSL